MNKNLNKIVPAALILLVVGALIAVAAMFSMKFDFTRLGTRKNETNTYTPSGDFDDILISTDTAEVVFLPSEDGKLKVVCVEETGGKHIVSTLSGKLTIQAVDTRKWYENLGVNAEKTSVTVYLPKKDYGVLNLGTHTGDVTVPAGFRFERVIMDAGTADIDFRAGVEGSVEIRTSTGGITLTGVQAASLDLKAGTGHIRVSESVVGGKVSAETGTGKVSFTDLNCAEAQVKTTTGNVDLVRVLASDILRVTTDTGDVDFDRSDAPEITVETDTGDVTGTLLTPKIFEADTGTGKVKLPRSEPGGYCTLKSDTGDFELTIAG